MRLRSFLGVAISLTIFVAGLGIIVRPALAGGNSPPPTGAVGQFVQNGKPTSPPVPLPDCRSCTVTQTGPHSYVVHIPKRVQQEMGR
jgi:hypothetical protein